MTGALLAFLVHGWRSAVADVGGTLVRIGLLILIQRVAGSSPVTRPIFIHLDQ